MVKKNTSIFQKEGDITVLDLLIILSNQIKVIIITPFVICIIAIVYVQFIAKPAYRSTSKIMSSSINSGVSQAVGMAAELGIALPGFTNKTEWVYSEILKSRSLAKTILYERYDTKAMGPQKQLIEILNQGSNIDLNDAKTISKSIDILLSMVSVSENITTSIYTIDVEASEPILARQINMSLLDGLDTHQRSYNKTKTSEARKFIEERIDVIHNELMISEEKLKDFSDRNRRIENSPNLQLERERLAREVAVLTGVFTTLKQQLETTKIEEVKESGYVVVLDPPELPVERSKPAKRATVFSSGIFGIIIGVLIALFREYFHTNNTKDREKYLKIKKVLFDNLLDLTPRVFRR